MRMLFINAIDPTRDTQVSLPPLGIGYMISALRQRFGNDAIEFEVVHDEIHETMSMFSPDIVGISAVSQNYERAKGYASVAQRHGAAVICGGPHITMMPQTLTRDMDVGVIGEGERTVCELAELYMEDGRLDARALKRVPGIVFRENGRFWETAQRTEVEPIDSIPRPAREFFPSQSHTYMFTGRGCPFRCTFCSSSRLWRSVRLFSPEYVVDEMGELYDQGVRSIHLFDDLFPISVDRVRAITELMKARGLHGKMTFGCAIRADMARDDILSALKEMGVVSLGMGLESGCQRTLEYLKGNGASVSKNLEAVRAAKRHGLSVSGTFIMGSPDETPEELDETYRFIRASGLSSFFVYRLTPLPGTPVWDHAESRGLVSPDMDWDRLDVEYGRDDAVRLVNRMDPEHLDAMNSKFMRLRRRKALYRLGSEALRHPTRVPRYLWGRLNGGNGH